MKWFVENFHTLMWIAIVSAGSFIIMFRLSKRLK